jgi:hypothetical protein
MARMNIKTDTMPYDQLKEEISNWFNSEDRRNLAFLKAICQAFQNRMEEYYKAGATLEDRSQRLEEIRRALIEIGFTHGEQTFTIAARGKCPGGRPTGGACP